MLSCGDYVLLLPEDAQGLDAPTYGKITALSGSSVTVTGHPDANLHWSISRKIAAERATSARDARDSQPGVWLRRPVAAHLSLGWVHGQVIGLTSTGVRLRHSDAESECELKSLVQTDPIITLLLWDVVLPLRYRASKVRQVHSRILDSLLGDAERRQPKPSRSISTILANVIPDEACARRSPILGRSCERRGDDILATTRGRRFLCDGKQCAANSADSTGQYWYIVLLSTTNCPAYGRSACSRIGGSVGGGISGLLL